MHAKSCHFHKPPCHKRSTTIIAETYSVLHTAGKSYDIFQCAAVFYAADIIAAVYTEHGPHENILHDLYSFRHF